MDFTIRTATPADAPVIADFNVRLAAETEQLHLDPACVAAGVEALLKDPSKGMYFVAESNGEVVGQMMITYEWSDWRNGNLWWIQSVYVREDFRRAGVFRTLFAHVRELGRACGEVRGLRLYVHADNHRAKQSYARHGMKQTHYEVFELELPSRS